MKRLFILDFDNTLVLNPNYTSLIHLPFIGRFLPRRYRVPEGTIRAVEELRRRGDHIIILTKTTVLPVKRKMRKIEEAGFKGMVDEVVVVRRKTPRVVRSLLKKFPSERAYMVGNSYKNDVLVALNSGVVAVYIPRGWGESQKVLKEKDLKKGVVVLERFEDVLHLP